MCRRHISCGVAVYIMPQAIHEIYFNSRRKANHARRRKSLLKGATARSPLFALFLLPLSRECDIAYRALLNLRYLL